MIRVSYGGDPLYSQMAVDSLAQWVALSQRVSQPILHPVGVLWFATEEDASARQALNWLRASGLGRWEGDAAAMRQRFPQMRFADDESGFIEADSGALIAGRGFKHGPAVGQRVAAHIVDAALSIEPRFSLATKATQQNRTVY